MFWTSKILKVLSHSQNTAGVGSRAIVLNKDIGIECIWNISEWTKEDKVKFSRESYFTGWITLHLCYEWQCFMVIALNFNWAFLIISVCFCYIENLKQRNMKTLILFVTCFSCCVCGNKSELILMTLLAISITNWHIS